MSKHHKHFEHLHVPDHWQQYWSKYPNGYSVLEALINWTSQVDLMSENVNDWNDFLVDFVKTFDKNLQDEVTSILNDWMLDGTLSQIINDEVFNMKADSSDLILLEKEVLDVTNNFPFYRIEDFGGKVNDSSFDNTPALLSTINHLISEKKKGKILFKSGIYTFKTPISISQTFDNIAIEGSSPHGANGVQTVFDYLGTGYFLTITNGGQYYTFRNFALNCHGASGFHLKEGTQKNVWVNFDRVRLYEFEKGINAADIIYSWFTHCALYPRNENFEYGIKIGGGIGGTELVYLDKVSVEGNNKSTPLSAGVIIENSFSIFLSNMDLCNIKNGYGLHIKSRSKDVYNISVESSNFIRNKNHIRVEAINNNINALSFLNNQHIFGGQNYYSDPQNEIGINVLGNLATNKLVQQVTINNSFFRSISSFSGYEMFFNNQLVNGVKIDNIQSTNTGGKWKHDFTGNNTIYKGLKDGFRFQLTGDGIKKSFTHVISSNSMYMNPPAFISNCELPIPFGVSFSNTYGGELSVTYNFSEAPRKGGFYMYVVSSTSNR